MFYFAPGGATKSQPRRLESFAGIGTKLAGISLTGGRVAAGTGIDAEHT
jgi:hypothetical protein